MLITITGIVSTLAFPPAGLIYLFSMLPVILVFSYVRNKYITKDVLKKYPNVNINFKTSEIYTALKNAKILKISNNHEILDVEEYSKNIEKEQVKELYVHVCELIKK